MSCKDTWFEQRAEVLGTMATALRAHTEGRKVWPRAKANTRWRKVQTASVIIYRKDEAPIVITPKEDKYIVEGI